MTETALTQHAGIRVPVICGAMYPCSNPELVAAVSEAGAIGIVQPISLSYVYGYDFRTGLRAIKQLTTQPFGMNVLIEQSSRRYRRHMEQWIEIALEEGVRFFVTSLGKPDWVVDTVHAAGGVVYHDATERQWGIKGVDCGVDGLIAVNDRAGGHAGGRNPEQLYQQLHDLGVPVVCAGGVATEQDFLGALRLGYVGVQMGTRFIATEECQASELYKHAILEARADDIVLSERITGVPVSIIQTAYIKRSGLKAGALARWMLRGRKTKHLMRSIYALKSLWQLKRASLDESGQHEYWQAGKSVAGIHSVESAGDIVRRFDLALENENQN
ncbi:MAG: NAD(P)H-dependent flavin oxidoreductase [Gammaproteobacteria bacterium]